MYCLGMAKWKLGKGSVLGWGYFYVFLFLNIKGSCVLLFVVFLMEKKILKKITVIGPSKILLLEIKTYYCASEK